MNITLKSLTDSVTYPAGDISSISILSWRELMDQDERIARGFEADALLLCIQFRDGSDAIYDAQDWKILFE